MASEVGGSSDRERRLDEIATAYLKAVEAGERPQPQDWIDRYPDFAAELTSFFAAQQQIAAMAGVETIGLDARQGSELGTLRYFGDYELLEEIARGGMGVVYKARQVSLNRLVAVKMILAGQLASATDVRRFQSEAEAAATLDHISIVPIYEVSEHLGQRYFSMKLIDGKSLAQHLTLPAEQTAQLVRAVAVAVHHAHQRGILHRDLKPANILIDADGRPHVTDFGLAKRIEADKGQTQSGAIVGTPSYMAPEQARGQNGLTTAVDVYSLGAVLYEGLTGRPPFRGATALETLTLILETEPTPPRSLNASIARDLETICLKCLEKDPSRRYASAQALASDLDRWLRGEPIEARAVSGWERGLKWAKRRPALAALLGVSALATILLVVGLSVSYVAVSAAKADADEALFKEKKALTELQESVLREQRSAYRTRAGLADRYLSQGNVRGGLDLLDLCEPKKLRGWEWYFLNQRGRGELRTLRVDAPVPAEQGGPREVVNVAHDGSYSSNDGVAVGAVALSPNGSLVASGGAAGVIHLHDSESGELKWVLRGHSRQVMALAFSPDGKTLASVSGTPGRKGEIKMWDAATGRQMWSIPGAQACVAFSPDGRLVAAGSGQFVRAWVVATGAEDFSFQGSGLGVVAVAFSLNGKLLAYADLEGASAEEIRENHIHVRDLATRKEIGTFDGSEEGHFPQALAFGPRCDTLVWAAVDRTHVVVWDARKPDKTRKVPAVVNREHRGGITSIAFCPDGALVTTSLDRSIRTWDLRPDLLHGNEIALRIGHTASVWALAVSRDGRRLATGAADGEIKLWDLETAPPVAAMATEGAKVSLNSNLAFSPDGRSLAAWGGDDTVCVYDVVSARIAFLLRGADASRSLAFSPDGKQLAASRAIRDQDIEPGLRIWDLATKQLLETPVKPDTPIYGVRYSPEGHYLAAIDKEGMIRLWDTKTGRLEKSFGKKGELFDHLTFCPNGRFVAACRPRAVHVWNVETGQEIRVFRGHTSGVSAVAFSPDGRRLASVGAGRHSPDELKIWELHGDNVMDLRGHAGGLGDLAFSPDGRRLAACAGSEVILWETEWGEQVLTLPAGAASVAFSPDGRRVAAIDSWHRITLWDAGPQYPLAQTPGKGGSQ